MFKKVTSLILAMGLMLSSNGFALSSFPDLNSPKYALFELSTGKIIAEENATVETKIASMTKIMTAVLVAENLDLNKRIKIKDTYNTSITKKYGPTQVSSSGGHRLVVKGDTYLTRELFDVMLVYSANDIALALGVEVAGSEAAFVKKMNEKAKEIGMKNTVFFNPHGLDRYVDRTVVPMAQQKTTLADMALLVSYASKNKEITRAVDKKSTVLTELNKNRKSTYNTTNSMLGSYNVHGMKTGTTSAAGKCLSTIFNARDKKYGMVTVGVSSAASNAVSQIKNDHTTAINVVSTLPTPPLSIISDTLESFATK